MIVDCANCSELFDLSSYKPGQKLRCRCGQVIVVPKEGIRTRVADTVRCAECGGELTRGLPECPYCNSLIEMISARLNSYCASCLALSPEGAKHCTGCGESLLKLLDKPGKTELMCPHCKVRLRRREFGGQHPLECPMCCGLFVEVDSFEKLLDGHKDQGMGVNDVAGPKKVRLVLESVKYLPCPICGDIMSRANYGDRSGVIIDYCCEHGYWLDAGELEKIAAWVASGGLARKYAFGSDDKLHNRVGRPATKSSRSEKELAADAVGDGNAHREKECARLADASFLDLFIVCLFGK